MIDMKDIYWTAGFIEGEGSFCKSQYPSGIRVQAGQKQRDPLDRLYKLYGGYIYKNKQGFYDWRVTGRRAIALMMTIYSVMSPRRKEQIEGVIAFWKTGMTKNEYVGMLRTRPRNALGQYF
jgi:hypothetical protein